MYPQNQRIHHEYSLHTEDAYFQRERFNHAHDSVERIVILLGSTLTTLLGLRFVFALLDANPGSGIVTFVDGFTGPFVAPFYGLFNYDHASLGSVSLQGYTLVAMLAYSLLAAGIARLVTITRY
jgi:YggT family protein